jgi:cytochrome P450
VALVQPDFTRSALLADPYPFYERLRSEDPVYWSDLWGGWLLLRYDDVSAALQNPILSANRTPLVMSQLAEGVRHEVESLERFMPMSIGFSDEPDHLRLRTVARAALSPRVFDRMRPRIQEIVDNLLDCAQGRDCIDVVRDLAYPLPATVISEMLGVAPDDRDLFKRKSDEIIALMGTGRATPEVARRAQQSLLELKDYFGAAIAERRQNPKGDLMTALIRGAADGTLLSDDELMVNAVFLLIGGHETTTSLIASGILALLEHPDELIRLKAEPSLIVSAIEEILRFNSPLQRIIRVALDDLEIRGKKIKKGDLVLAMVGAANRDPEQFPDPDRFDVARPENRHLAFGYATRFCLGAPLARMEGQIAINTLLRRFPRLRLGEAAREWQDNLAFRCLKSLPVRM